MNELHVPHDWLALDPLPHIGFIGVGNMGLGMLTRWRALGGPAVVHDIDPVRTTQAQALGAVAVDSPAAVAGALPAGGLLVVCVVNADDCRDVLWGDKGAAPAMKSQQTVLLTPTLSPDDVCDFARQLGEQGVHLIDAPMSGGPVRAAKGTMSLMVAGPTRHAWWPVLQRSARTRFVSEADRGQLSMGAAHVRRTRTLLPLDWKTWRLPLAKKGRCSAPGVSDATVQEFNRCRHLRDKHSAD